jgi:hypothetical protein
MDLSKEQITESLRQFKNRQDALLHEDEVAFDHHMQRFVEFCHADPLAQSVLKPLLVSNPDIATWWESCKSDQDRGKPRLSFPANQDEELALRFEILATAAANSDWILQFGFAFREFKHAEGIELFRVLIIRPFVEEFGHRLSEAANLATPEERALQAVPLNRIPSGKEVRIFLSHKTVDKPLVYRYYNALKQLGFAPWLDEPEMPVGTNFEREVFKGFEESCAAVFFITDNFKDEKYLAAEVDYAVMQKRKKNNKFAIVTLRYSDAAQVPALLTPYIYKTVSNDLEGFYELLRALPIELGPVRWKSEIVE